MKQLLMLLALLLLGGCTHKPTETAVTLPEAPAVVAEAPAVVAERPRPETAVVLTELVADNRTAMQSEDGLFPDYLVLTNAGSESEDLSGWHLSQKEGRWGYTLPMLTLKSGESVTLYCDGRNRELHTDFSLKAGGESIVLSDRDGNTLWALDYPALGGDQGYCRRADGDYELRDLSCGARLPAGLCISECVSFNRSLLPIGQEYYDWVELYNGGREAVDLADYTLSDKRDPDSAYPIASRSVKPGEYCVILCVGSDTPVSADPTLPFSLDGRRDSLYLRHRDGRLLDYCSLHDIPLGGSYGRSGESWLYYETPTPRKANGPGFEAVSGSVTADAPEGCYEVDSLTVSLSGSGEVRYTLDGSEPTAESALYTGPLTFSETTVLRARAYEPGKCPGRVCGFSYLLNEGHTLPVVSLIMDGNAFFKSCKANWAGIYYLEANTIEPELLTDVSFFEGNGEGFHAQSTVCLHGASTRHSREKKSLKLSFRGAYGGDVHYDLFGDGEERYHSLCLRSGYMEDNSLLRDSICQTTAIRTPAKVMTLRNRYCVLYLNGEYWGIYSLREAYSKAYAADHLGSSREEVSIVRSPVRAWYEEDMFRLMTFLSSHRASTPESYKAISDTVDLESLADWMVLETYFFNYDLPGNIRYIRANDHSPYLYAFFDLDFGLRRKNISWDHTLSDGNQFGLLTSNIIRFPEFQQLLLERMALLYENGLCEETQLELLDRYAAELAPELPREYARWTVGAADTEERVNALREMILDHRQSQCFDSLCKRLYLDRAATAQQYFGGRELE